MQKEDQKPTYEEIVAVSAEFEDNRVKMAREIIQLRDLVLEIQEDKYLFYKQGRVDGLGIAVGVLWGGLPKQECLDHLDNWWKIEKAALQVAKMKSTRSEE